MNKVIKGRSIDTIFVLIIFSTFAFSILMVLMLGAGIYRNVNDISREGQYEHTALAYVWTKTKNNDDVDSIHVSEFNGKPALFIIEETHGLEFNTIIYHYDGWIFELFSEVGREFPPGGGMRIVMVDDLHFEEISYGLVKVTVGDKSLLLSPRGSLNEVIG